MESEYNGVEGMVEDDDNGLEDVVCVLLCVDGDGEDDDVVAADPVREGVEPEEAVCISFRSLAGVDVVLFFSMMSWRGAMMEVDEGLQCCRSIQCCTVTYTWTNAHRERCENGWVQLCCTAARGYRMMLHQIVAKASTRCALHHVVSVLTDAKRVPTCMSKSLHRNLMERFDVSEWALYMML